MFIPKTRKHKTVKEWTRKVKERDGFKCKKCGADKKLVAHHIIEWEISPELRIDINNGMTLCVSCHMEHHMKDKPKGWNSGHIPWNKGLKGVSTGWPKGKKRTPENIEKMRQNMLGKPSPRKGVPMKESTKELLRTTFAGKISMNEEQRKNHSDAVKGKTWVIDPDSGKRKWIDKI